MSGGLTRSALANLFALALQVDDDVCDRNREALAGAADDALFQPVRPPFGVGRADDLVGAESAEGVLDRLQRLAVADLAVGLDARVVQTREAALEAPLRSVPRLIVVRDPVLERGVQRRRHDEHLGSPAFASLANRLAQGLASDGLVRDYENPPFVLGSTGPGRRENPRPTFTAAEVEEEHDRAEHDEDCEPEPPVDHGAGDDQPEVTDRQPDEPIRLGLAAKRVQRHGAVRGRTPS